MKIGTLFNLITDVSDVLDFFQRVDAEDQLVSRLERLKRQGTDALLSCLESLRTSLTVMLRDTLEMSSSLDGSEREDLDIDETLANLTAEEDQNHPSPDEPETTKNEVSTPK